MKETSHWQFGLMIAYLLPGFIGLAGLVPFFPAVAHWLQPISPSDFGLGPPLYAILAAITMGMIVSCFRWLLIDQIHSLTGVPAPSLNYRAIEECIEAFNYLVENHYRFYQFYANTLLAMVWAYSVNRWMKTSSLLSFGTDIGVLLLCAVLFAGSRDALAKYRTRNAERRNNTAERLMNCTPPVKFQAWLTTFDELIRQPLGPVWICPRDYAIATEGTAYAPQRRREVIPYVRRPDRERLVDERITLRTLFEDVG